MGDLVRPRLLIVAQGVAAVQLVDAAWEAGWQPVCVYTEQGFNSLAVRRAGVAVAVPGDSVAACEPQQVVAVALRAGCVAVHPGFGVLRDSAELVRLAAAAGLSLLWGACVGSEFAGVVDPPAAFAAAVERVDTAVAQRWFWAVGYVSARGVQLCGVVERVAAVRDAAVVAEVPAVGAQAVTVLARRRLQLLAARGAQGFVTLTLTAFGDVVWVAAVQRGLPVTHRVLSAALGWDLLVAALAAEVPVAGVPVAGVPVAGCLAAVGEDILPLASELVCGEVGDAVTAGCAVGGALLAADASLGFAPQSGWLSTVVAPGGPGVLWDAGYASGDWLPVDDVAGVAALTVRGVDRVAAWRSFAGALRAAMVAPLASPGAVLASVLLADEVCDAVAAGAAVAGAAVVARVAQLAPEVARLAPQEPPRLCEGSVVVAGRQLVLRVAVGQALGAAAAVAAAAVVGG